jgi:hypothetical protein
MRVYALVLGAIATTGSAYVAEVAVSSAGVVQRHAQRQVSSVDFMPSRGIWYGGMLEPITITARRLPPPILVTQVGAGADTARCRALPSRAPTPICWMM